MSIMMMTWTKTADLQHVTNSNIGVAYWSCYRIHLTEYFENLLKVEALYNRKEVTLFPFLLFLHYESRKVKLIAHNLKLLAISLEDAIKEDPDKYLERKSDSKFGYRFDDDDDGYAD